MRPVGILLVLLCCAGCTLFPVRANSAENSATTIPKADLLQPEELAKELGAKDTAPVILQVGFSVLFDQAHIPGAQYAGPTSRRDGIENLNDHVQKLARDRLIVIYCGCCPWTRCPNIAPAYQQLRAMGFTNVKALYLADNFGANWIDKGYPVVRSQ